MQAKCPQCGATFQTERTGAQFCPNCGQQVNVADVGAGPAGAAPPAPGAAPPGGAVLRGPTPWERRGELGFVQGLWQTVKLLVLDPDRFWRTVRPDGPVSDALFYGWINSVLRAAISVPFLFLTLGSLGKMLAQLRQAGMDIPPESQRMIETIFSGPGLYGMVIGGALLYPLALVISSALVHVFGMMFGAAKHGFGATMRVLAYSTGPVVLAGIPYVGGLVGIYVIVLEVWGILRVHETTGVRAAGAVLGFPVLICCCACLGGVFAAMALMPHH